MKVTVIDYGVGNLHSVLKALRESGGEPVVTAEPRVVGAAEQLVLPGVGAFGEAMAALKRHGLDEATRGFAATGRPLLGVCLGMQLFFTESAEFGRHAGLNLLPGRVVEIPRRAGFKVPHTGWSEIAPPPNAAWSGSVLADLPSGTHAYFVHSFSAQPACEEDRLADTDYGGFRISAAVRRGNVTGCQFHPEKSGPAGLAILRRFLHSRD
jgi:glutamine amidotransferase